MVKEARPDRASAARDPRVERVENISLFMSEPLMSFEQCLRIGDLDHARGARVAVRRLRARLGLATECFGTDWIWLVRRELRHVEQAIGDVIDADTLLSWVREEQLDDRDEKARGELMTELSRERSRAQRRLIALFDSARYERMLRDLGRRYMVPVDMHKYLRGEWRALQRVVGSVAVSRSHQELHRMAGRVDRVRHGVELCPNAMSWGNELGELRDTLDALGEASLAQDWLRHAASTPNVSWVLVCGVLIERARSAELAWWGELMARWERVGSNELRSVVLDQKKASRDVARTKEKHKNK